MPWWGWLIIGVLLLATELVAVDAQFYLVFLGVAAILVGIGDIAGPELPIWVEWLSFAVLSGLMMVTVRRNLYDKLRVQPLDEIESDVGRTVSLAEELAPGTSCRTEYRGAMWTAMNVGAEPIPAGGEARIVSVEGLTLRVSQAADNE